jgi:hypothetical protein
MEGRIAARLKKASHAGIIRIGFEGISQPRNAAEHPCFNKPIETLPRGNCKCVLRWVPRESSLCEAPAISESNQRFQDGSKAAAPRDSAFTAESLAYKTTPAGAL